VWAGREQAEAAGDEQHHDRRPEWSVDVEVRWHAGKDEQIRRRRAPTQQRLAVERRAPTPTSSGTSVTPKLACALPKKRQNE
jgi:hypothetical protein